MRWRQNLVFTAILLSAALSFAQSEDWLPITPQDLQMKEVPGHAGAYAVRLYYAHFIDDNTLSEFNYTRIKILNEKGLQSGGPADVAIPFQESPLFLVFLTELKARTIHPDGSIVEFTGKPFDKTVFKGRGFKFAAKTFTMPDVTVGSIIEYKYKYRSQRLPFVPFDFFPPGEWVIQSDLFTVKEHLYFKPFEAGTFQSLSRASSEWDGAQVETVSANLKEPIKKHGNESELELQNVQAFEAEDNMPPEDDFKPNVRFYYARRGTSSVSEKAWQELGKDRYNSLEEFISKDHGVKDAAIQAIGGETDPLKKLQKLYQRTQSLRNLTYERDRSSEERKKENIKPNLSVGDVLAHGYGIDDEISMLFAAMARSAGFDAQLLQASDRRRRFFSKDFVSLVQMNDVVVVVKLNDQEIYLDPGTRFCPFGMLRWNHTVIEALKLSKKGGAFVNPPAAAYDKNVTRRTAKMVLTEDGTAKGEITLEFRGYEGLEHRLDAIDRDEAGRKKELEDELKQWLPVGALVKMTAVQGWENGETPLVARFSVEVPAYASLAGKRLLVPTYLFHERQKDAFKRSERKYPLYFAYPFTEDDIVIADVPAGFTVENVPPKLEAGLPYAKYQNLSQFDGHQLVTQRRLMVNSVYVPLDKYPELKGFFGKVQVGDEQQAVLHGGNVNAQKGN